MAFLWLCRWPPYEPLRGGDVDYSREAVHSLARGHPTIGLAFATPEVSIPADAPLRWEFVAATEPPEWMSLLSPLPNVAYRHHHRAYLERAIALGRDADAVFVDFLGLAWMVEPLVKAFRAAGSSTPVIMVTHNHEFAVRTQMWRGEKRPIMRAVLALDTWKAGRLEKASNAAAQGLTAITEADAAIFAGETDTPSIVITPGYSGPVVETRRIDESTPRRACILGNRTAHHKFMVLQRTLAAFQKRGIGRAMGIDIVGDGDFTGLRKDYPAFNFIGFVPAIEEYLGGVRLGLISDDIGGGFKLRALTYAFLRVPMLAVRDAMNGMGFEEGVHFIGVDSVDEMAKTLTKLIDDVERLDAVQTAAYDHCAARYDWATRGQALADFAARLRKAA